VSEFEDVVFGLYGFPGVWFTSNVVDELYVVGLASPNATPATTPTMIKTATSGKW
jgi:hypothetical protein